MTASLRAAAALAAVWTLSLAALPARAQQPDVEAIIGTWQLDVAHSTFKPGPAPRAEVRVYEADHEGIRTTVKTEDANGRVSTMEFVASFNEVDAAVTGSTSTDAVRMKKIDDYTAEGVLLLRGTRVGTTRRVIARDGRSMTITLTREAPTPVTNVTVYRRVALP
jgi:hypothetical protein